MQSNTGSSAILVERRLGSDAYRCGSAFVIITDVLEEGSAEKPPMYLVESLEKIPDADAPTAPDHIRRLVYFASLTTDMQGTSSQRKWSDAISPANAGKCRRLGKSPTGEDLEKYSAPA